MGFIDQMRDDFPRSFFCPWEFGERHDVNGTEMTIVLTQKDVQAQENDQSFFSANNYTHTSGVTTKGVYRSVWELFVPVSSFGAMPKQKSVILIDQERRFLVITADDEGGVYRMELEESRS